MSAGADSAAPAEPGERILRANTGQLLPEERLERELGAQWSGVGLWLRWVVGTAAGWLATGLVTGFVAGTIGSVDHAVITGATYLMTPLTYTLQWLVLRPRLPKAWRWVPISVAGEAVALALWVMVGTVFGPALSARGEGMALFVRTLVEGFPPAVAQWLLLRTVAGGAWRWIVATLIWVSALALLTAANSGNVEMTPGLDAAITLAIVTALSSTILGALASAVSGIALVSILRRSRSEPAAQS